MLRKFVNPKIMPFMKTFRLLAFAGVFLALGCASKNFNEPYVADGGDSTVSRTFSSSFGNSWDAVNQLLRDKNIPVAQARRDKGELITEWIHGPSDRLFSGYGDVKIPYKARYQLTFDIRPSKSGTRVLIKSREQFLSDAITSGSDFTGSLYKWVETSSTGKHGNDFLKDLEDSMRKE